MQHDKFVFTWKVYERDLGHKSNKKKTKKQTLLTAWYGPDGLATKKTKKNTVNCVVWPKWTGHEKKKHYQLRSMAQINWPRKNKHC